MNTDATATPISRIGRYEILGTLARGGMATVYLARLAAAGGFSREFALKVIHPHLAAEKGFRERLLEEARLASRVHHPNAVTTIDAGEDQGYAYLVLELIDGVNLRQLMLHRSRPFSAEIAAAIVAAVSRGLHALHIATNEDGTPLGMVHRDLSPHNVMIDRDGRAILIDLGLAKAEGREDLTQVGVLAGKIPYMSPEQARMETLDARSDVFAMGIVLYQLATGEMPFGDSASLPTLERLQRCELDRVHEGIEKYAVPKWLAEVVLKCLEADPAQRIQTADELADVLEQELQHAGKDETTIRRTLASLVEDASAELQPAPHEDVPLAPIVPIPRSQRFAFATRWALVGGVAATIGAFWTWSDPSVIAPLRGSSTPEMIPGATETPRDGGSLAADGVPNSRDALPTTTRRVPKSKQEPVPEEARPGPDPTAVDAHTPGDAQLTAVELLEPDLAPEKPRRRRPGPSELKPNPYAQ
jgi:serine/threonine protein kinase